MLAITGVGDVNGGIARANLNVLQALSDTASDAGRTLHVVSLHDGPGARPDFLAPGISFVACRGHKSLFALRLWRLFRRGAIYVFDHVHLALPLAPVMALELVKVVIFAHGSESWRRVRPTSRWLFRAANLCLTNSRYTLGRMEATFEGFRARHCQLGLPPGSGARNPHEGAALATPRLRSVDGERREIGARMILLVARMHPGEREKGHDLLLETWPRVVARYPDAQLVFAGPGDDRERLAARAAEQRVADSIFLPGYLEDDELQALYASCHAFVMPSTQEGFGLVYLEAMSHARACVGCRGNGAEDVIVHGESGHLLNDPRDSGELYEVISRLFDEPDRTRELGRRGLALVQGHFSTQSAQARIRESVDPVICSR